MDFSLIEEHPWKTTAVIGIGALLLYLYFRRGSSSAAADTSVYGGAVAPAVDPNAAAYNLQGQQIQAQLAGLQIQSQGAVALKQLDVGATTAGIAAQQDITNRQTDAALSMSNLQTVSQLQLGLGSQQSTVDLARIQASVQLASIEAIERAYGLLNGPTGPNNVTPGGIPAAPPVYNVGGAPGSSVGSTTTPPVYVTNPAPPVGISSTNGLIINVTPGGAPLPGGSPVVNFPNFETCSPLDPACVQRNQTLDANYGAAVATAQVVNNRNQCYANAALSVGKPNYDALVASCATVQ
jgi:hypothetical protein